MKAMWNLQTMVQGLSIAAATFLAGAAGAAWMPTDLGSNLALWLDAQDSATLTTDVGGAVSQWNDKSGNGNHLTQATAAAQPSAATGINGHASVAFNGRQNYMMCSATSGLPTGNSDFSVVIVYRYDSSLGGTVSTSAYPVAFGTASSKAMTALDFKKNGGRFVHYAADQNMPAPQPAFFDGDMHLVVDVYDSTTLLEQLYVDGATGPAVTQAAALNLGTDYISLNTFSPANINYGEKFQIGEVLIVSSKLSAADLNSLNAYMETRWAVPEPASMSMIAIGGLMLLRRR